MQGTRCVGSGAGDIIATHGGVCGSEMGFVLTGVRNIFVAEVSQKQIQGAMKNLQAFQTSLYRMYRSDIRAPMGAMLIHKDDEFRLTSLDDWNLRWLNCQESIEPIPQGCNSKFEAAFGGMDHLRVR